MSANARSIIRRSPTARQYAFPCTHTSVHARRSARVPVKRRDPKSKQTSPIAGTPWCPIEDSPQLTTTSGAACPFVATERACLSLSLSLLRHWLSSSFTDTPSCLSTPLSIFETEATRRPRSCPGVMRFYESKSGLRALDLFPDPLSSLQLAATAARVTRGNINATVSSREMDVLLRERETRTRRGTSPDRFNSRRTRVTLR